MRRILVAALLVAAATVGAYSVVIKDSAVRPAAAQAHQSCADFWANSGHTANVVFYDCHNWTNADCSPNDCTTARVHICGTSGTLHGIYVQHVHRPLAGDIYQTIGPHSHDPGGEGC
jgi:hypothetical protein